MNRIICGKSLWLWEDKFTSYFRLMIRLTKTVITGCQRGRGSDRFGDSGSGYGGVRGVWPGAGQDSPLQGDHAGGVRGLRPGHAGVHLHLGLWIHRRRLLQQHRARVRSDRPLYRGMVR